MIFPLLRQLHHQNTSSNSVPPLFAAAVDSWRLLQRRLEDGLEDGDVLLEDDRGHGEVPLQFVGALAEICRQLGHVLPLVDLVEKLDEAAETCGASSLQQTQIIIINSSVSFICLKSDRKLS